MYQSEGGLSQSFLKRQAENVVERGVPIHLVEGGASIVGGKMKLIVESVEGDMGGVLI